MIDYLILGTPKKTNSFTNVNFLVIKDNIIYEGKLGKMVLNFVSIFLIAYLLLKEKKIEM